MTTATETKHTPGPWEVTGDRDSDEGLTVEARGGEVAFIASTTGYARADIANAFLIAAAPELLEALEHMVAVSNWATTIQSEEQYDAMIANAEAAIRKAKGDS